jgi:hypothetical protein
MTSTTTGLPDRYRPLDQVGPDEPTPTGVIRCWRAKDRVLNRDVAIRVHTPAGEAAHEWITRALTAGGLATPALAMVYDASQGVGDPQAPGGAAYVVNEWIDGETLTERLSRGPLPEREIRTVLRRLAEGVAEAHRVGLAVGGLTAENVVLRPNGLVGLRGVPAATGTVDGDIAALGGLLETCLGGGAPGDDALQGPPDLVALARRTRSTEPGQGLTSVAAMAALLAARPPVVAERSRSVAASGAGASRNQDADGGWLNRLRDRRADAAPAGAADTDAESAAGRDADLPVRLDPDTLPPVPAARPLTTGGSAIPAAALGGDTIDASTVAPAGGAYAGQAYSAPTPPPARPGAVDHPHDAVVDPDTYGNHSYTGEHDAWLDEPFDVLGPHAVSDTSERGYGDTGTHQIEEHGARHRLLVVGLPLLALIVVIALAYWFGSSVLSVAGSVDDIQGSTPSAGAPASTTSQAKTPAATGAPIPIAGAAVYDPFGSGRPDHPDAVALSYDANPATDWATYKYRGAPTFGNLKPGVGVLYDLGDQHPVAAVTVTTTLPGSTMQIRTGNASDGALDSFAAGPSGTVKGTTKFTFDKPATARYVLVWITGLVPTQGAFQADLAEVAIQPAA